MGIYISFLSELRGKGEESKALVVLNEMRKICQEKIKVVKMSGDDVLVRILSGKARVHEFVRLSVSLSKM